MGSGLQLNEVLDTILELTMREVQAQQGSILLFDEHQDRLEMLASYGLPHEIVEKGYIARKGSIAEWVIDHGEPMILNDRALGGDFRSLDDKRRLLSSMCLPLRSRGGVLGTLNLNRTNPRLGPFVQEQLDGMVILASQAAIYIENSRLYESNLRSERLAAIGQTVAGISHCVKNVLTGLKGGAALSKVARQSRDWEMADQAGEILDNSVNRITSLVLEMLDYCKEREPVKETVDLDELLKEIKGVTRSRAMAQGSEIVVELAEDALTVHADSQQLFRCLLNLVDNALHANGEGGKVTVSSERSTAEGALRRLSGGTKRAEAAIILRVADEGGGIDAASITQIFEPFFSTKGSKGTGLGLAVTRKIVREHGGELDLASAPNEPAVFALYLPEMRRAGK